MRKACSRRAGLYELAPAKSTQRQRGILVSRPVLRDLPTQGRADRPPRRAKIPQDLTIGRPGTI